MWTALVASLSVVLHLVFITRKSKAEQIVQVRFAIAK